MSTRSGKRIHSLFHESSANNDIELAVRSERKTRSRRFKENVDEVNITLFKNKKRSNYVSYPTDEELSTDAGINLDDEGKNTRVLRKNTLKEHNIVTPTTNKEELFTDTKKHARTTRRTRKITENVSEDSQEVYNVKNPSADEKPKPKNKKKKLDTQVITESVPKKKSKNKRKVRRSSSIVVEEIEPEGIHIKGLNRSNMSVDSFHSAAGSLEIDGDIQNIAGGCDEMPASNTDINHKTFENNDTKLINSVEKSKKKRTSVCDSSFKNFLSQSTDSIVFQNLNPLDKENKTKRRLSVKDSTKKDIDIEPYNTFTKELKKRKSSITNTTFDKNVSITSTKENEKNRKMNNSTFDSMSTRSKRKSTINYAPFDAQVVTTNNMINTTFEKGKDNSTNIDAIDKGRKRKSTFNEDNNDIMTSSIIKKSDATFEKDGIFGNSAQEISSLYKRKSLKDTTFEKDGIFGNSAQEISSLYKRKSLKDTTFEKDGIFGNSAQEISSLYKRKSLKDTTFEKDNVTNTTNNDTNSQNSVINNTTFEKVTEENVESMINEVTATKSAIKDTTFEKDRISNDSATFEAVNKHKLLQKLSNNSKMNTTFEKDEKLDATFDKYKKLDITFDKSNSKSSLISSDETNISLAKSDTSCISITSDESRDNIVNTTLVLIESSMDESHTSNIAKESPKCNETLPPSTPLKREGTFTKDGPDLITMPQKDISTVITPTKRMSLPSPGYTPFHVTKSNQKEKSVLNLTRSIEKGRRSSLAEVVPRVTKVMFCSPVSTAVVVAQQKKKVIKSNLKGSNKSFVFDESAARGAAARKRSRTQCDAAEARAKRKRLAGDPQHSGDRLSRPRTTSASAKLTEPSTPPKRPVTPSKAKPEAKVARTKLPNFAALHQRHFDKMESLDECQERKAKRAKQLLTPTGAVSVLETTNHKDTVTEPQKTATDTNKLDTPLKSLPTLKSLNPGYTRFGFKLNLDVNPFSIPYKATEVKPKENKPNGLTRRGTLPSLTGTTSLRREAAKQTVMREKSFTERRNNKRNENRTIIKGVRTNRRFELQMRLRNLE